MDVDDLIQAVGSRHAGFGEKPARIAKLLHRWVELEKKFVRMIERGHRNTARLAYATLFMMETGIRTGNERSSEGWICENQIICRKDNPEKGLKVGDVIWRHPMFGQHVQTFGLTTLQNGHVKRRAKSLVVSFTGKKLVDQELIIKHPTLIRYCPIGERDGRLWLNISYHELKKFVKKSIGKYYSPKDIRMAKVNLIFINIMGNHPRSFEFDEAKTKSARKKILSEVLDETANIIGHTKSVCRSAYMSQPLIQRLSQ